MLGPNFCFGVIKWNRDMADSALQNGRTVQFETKSYIHDDTNALYYEPALQLYVGKQGTIVSIT